MVNKVLKGTISPQEPMLLARTELNNAIKEAEASVS